MDPSTREYHYFDLQIGGYQREYYVGDAAMQLRGVLKLAYPVERGIIEDWVAMEKIWHHLFYYEMRIDPAEHPVAMLCTELTPRPALEKIAEILFETFNVPAVCLVSDGAATMAAMKKRTGIAVILEDGYTSIMPYINGLPISQAIKKLDPGMHHVYSHLRRLLVLNEKSPHTVFRLQPDIMDIVDKLGTVSVNAVNACGKKVPYVLYSGDQIVVDDEPSNCFDVYFRQDPATFGFDCPPIQQAIVQCIEDTLATCADVATRKAFLESLAAIPVVGPAARIPGWQERLTREFQAALPRAWRGGGNGDKTVLPDLTALRFVVPDRPEHAPWRGLARLAQLSAGDPRAWVTLEEYRASGPTLVHRMALQEYIGR